MLVTGLAGDLEVARMFMRAHGRPRMAMLIARTPLETGYSECPSGDIMHYYVRLQISTLSEPLTGFA